MLRRSIDPEPFGPTFQEKFSRNAKRACVVLAATALSISTLDMMNVPVAAATAGFIDDGLQRVADLPVRMRSEIDRMSVHIPLPTAVVAMWSPPAPAQRDKPDAAAHAASMKLASLDAGVLPTIEIDPLPRSAAHQMPDGTAPRTASNGRLPSPAERLHLAGGSLAKAERCLANAIYFEARDEPVRGQFAVAQVILNRVFSGFYPHDVCGVIYQNAHRHLECQFTFACDGKRKVINERGAWARATRIAAQILAGDVYDPAVGTSTHYHALYVHPSWVHEMRKLARYGTHNFYRPIAWGKGANEPVWGNAQLAKNQAKAK